MRSVMRHCAFINATTDCKESIVPIAWSSEGGMNSFNVHTDTTGCDVTWFATQLHS